MARFIGIDYGSKRVGIAISDDNGIIASPLETIHSENLIPYLKQFVASGSIAGFVIGLPVGLKGEDTNVTKKVRQIMVHLNRVFPDLPVHAADERFTSKMAGKALIEGNVSKKKRSDKGLLDKISAAILLQSFLDKRSNQIKNSP